MEKPEPSITSTLLRHARWLHPLHAPKTHAVILGLVGVLSAFAVFLPNRNEASTSNPAAADLNARYVSNLSLNLPATQEGADVYEAPTYPPADNQESSESWRHFTVKTGDSLGDMFKKAGIGTNTLHKILASNTKARQLARIKSGQKVAFLLDENKQLQKFKLEKNRLDSVLLTRNESGYSYEEIHRVPNITYSFARIPIDSSLFQSANRAGVDDNLTMELASVFGWDIDFVLDIRKGDSFNFVYEDLILDGEKIGHGDIVSAEFVTKAGASYQAVRYTNEQGLSRYFTPTGISMHKEFLRTPVDFAQISSNFNLKRMHPVLHKIRAHKGTDYAAATGTPVRATGNGRVTFADRKGGYGNTIMIQHGQTYETVYAHLSKYARGIKAGAKVTQGQVIGYVGMTGLATGPHLHYEFHVNGEVRNPVTVRFPNSSPISSSERPRFLAQTQNYMMQLASYTHKLTPTQIALAE